MFSVCHVRGVEYFGGVPEKVSIPKCPSRSGFRFPETPNFITLETRRVDQSVDHLQDVRNLLRRARSAKLPHLVIEFLFQLP